VQDVYSRGPQILLCITDSRQEVCEQASYLTFLQESQPTKNCNLSRLISNLSRLNWSSERNCVYCFSTVFTLLQQQEVPLLHMLAYSAFIRHCPFYDNILNDIKDHRTSSKNRNRGNRGNIKSRQRGPSRLRLCFRQPDLSLTEGDSSCARQRARFSTFIVSESLFPIRSHG